MVYYNLEFESAQKEKISVKKSDEIESGFL